MVRPRIQLQRLEGELSREHYYLHNKSIIAKKVKEMSVMTGTDVLFMDFSPVGIPTLHLGEYSNFINIVKRFLQVSQEDREKRRHNNLQTMKTNYHKDGYNIDVKALFDAWKARKLESMKQELADLKKELHKAELKKRFYENPQRSKLNKELNRELVLEIEAELLESLDAVRKRRAELLAQEKMNSEAPREHVIRQQMMTPSEPAAFGQQVMNYECPNEPAFRQQMIPNEPAFRQQMMTPQVPSEPAAFGQQVMNYECPNELAFGPQMMTSQVGQQVMNYECPNEPAFGPQMMTSQAPHELTTDPVNDFFPELLNGDEDWLAYARFLINGPNDQLQASSSHQN